MTWYRVLKESQMNDGDLFKAKVNGKEILIIKDEGKFYATSLYCTHEQYDLSDGFMDDHKLICPNHFATFDPKDGSVVSPPEGSGDIEPLKSYRTKVENGDVLVEVD
ncbi:(2Fe-2S)-binding protein [Thermogymnomonas acidicola]|uniref:(2Fe-2S)-binding protein n=1 Tax=Thermogymnomonas acidicola TaxID=399579 RepID=A0AA37BQZ9_9ARCH|nr:Rieske (2Fe-2S) protein [Thermogymnomonas acidicola]GGM68815.1 (2Fe-2S)-binding protein [Thermogymnomonas acidicola]